ncbi:DegV family protein [Vallitalea sediminicola]
MGGKLAIVADTTCDLPKEIIKQYNIKLIPLRVIYKDRDFRDRMEISPKEVYNRLNYEIPKTSLPVAEDVINVFEELLTEGYTDAIVLTLSSKVSGTYNLINLVAKEYQQLNIEVIDSKAVSMFYGFMVLEAARFAYTGNHELIKEKIWSVRNKVKGCHLIDTLVYLKAGGRIGKVEGTIGGILNIKPIIGIDTDGVYYPLTKVRGRKRAIHRIRSMIEEEFSNKNYTIAIVHGGAEEDAKAMIEDIKNIGIKKEIIMTCLSPVSCVHTGSGLIGYVAYEV